MIKEVDELTEQLYHNQLLFDHVEIETINRCNGICDFCPVSKQNDIREYRVMREELFKKIVEELAEINYGGKIALFSNNEPFLDDRIIEWNKYAREKIKNARIHLFTNGTLLTLDKFISIIDYLDELIIDNYTLNGQLLRTCKDICDYCNVHEELKSKVTIVMRNPHEILSSRGGSAPNRSDIKEYKDNRCALPFRQMIIRPSGEVSLCCNDPLGKYTLGDVNVQTLSEIWYGEKFNNIRKRLYLGRKNIEACSRCDNISLG